MTPMTFVLLGVAFLLFFLVARVSVGLTLVGAAALAFGTLGAWFLTYYLAGGTGLLVVGVGIGLATTFLQRRGRWS